MIQDHEPKCDECGHILPLAGPCTNCGKRPDGVPIYVAGAYADKDRVRECMRMARARGLHVVHDWPTIIEQSPGDAALSDEEARQHAQGDLDALEGAKALWLVVPPEGHGRGSWWEGGEARQAGIPIVASGPNVRGTVFTALGRRYQSDEHALDHIVWVYGEGGVRDADLAEFALRQISQPVVKKGPLHADGSARCRGCSRSVGQLHRPGCEVAAKAGDPSDGIDRSEGAPGELRDSDGNRYPAPGVWQNPARCGGDPCVDGTRIPTRVIAGRYAAGESMLDLLADYPGLGEDRDKVEAALRYELNRLYDSYEPEDEGDDDEDDPLPFGGENEAYDPGAHQRLDEHDASIRALDQEASKRLAELEEKVESIDAATAGAIHDLTKRVNEGFATQRAVVKRSTERVDRLWRELTEDNDHGLLRRIEWLERDLAKLRASGEPESRREHATAAFAYVCGRMGKPMYDVSGPLCGEPLPNAWGTCPFPKPCPFHTGAERSTEAAE